MKFDILKLKKETMKKTMKKTNSPFFVIRAEKAKERFTKVHELNKLGLKNKQIIDVLVMAGHVKISQSTISSYLQFETYSQYSQFHKDRLQNSKARRTEAKAKAMDLEAKQKALNIISTQTPEERHNDVAEFCADMEKIDLLKKVNVIEDLIADAYEKMQQLKLTLNK